MSRVEPKSSSNVEPTAPVNPVLSRDIEAFSTDQSSSPTVGAIEPLHAQTFGRILKVMQVTGIYYGETNLTGFPASSSARSRVLGWFYCCFVVFLLWIAFYAMLVNLVYELGSNSTGRIFFKTQVSLWNLLCAGNAATCVFALPIGRRRHSRFERFLRQFAATIREKAADKRRIHTKAFRGLMLFLLFVMAISLYITFAVPQFSQEDFKPWSQYSDSIFIISRTVVVLFGQTAWVVPIFLFSTVCSFLVDDCQDLEKRLNEYLKKGTLDVNSFRRDYGKLLKAVELADKTFSSLMFVNFACYIPFLTLLFYYLATFPSVTRENVIELITFICYGLFSSSIVSALLFKASKVNEKASIQM